VKKRYKFLSTKLTQAMDIFGGCVQRADIELKPGFTAEAYLDQRLKNIGIREQE